MMFPEMAMRLTHLQARIAAACHRAGRDPASVTLLPVSKTFDVTHMRAAIALGLRRFGENKVQEVRDKAAALANCQLPIEWVAIGSLQTNKAKEVVKLFTEVQSLDRLELAEALDRRLQQAGLSLDVLVQVKTSNEPGKRGLPPRELATFLRRLDRDYETLRVRGLMTLAVNSTDMAAVRACFQQLRQWRDRLWEMGIGRTELTRLSMGMSGDFEIAIEEGATEVRIGSALLEG